MDEGSSRIRRRENSCNVSKNIPLLGVALVLTNYPCAFWVQGFFRLFDRKDVTNGEKNRSNWNCG